MENNKKIVIIGSGQGAVGAFKNIRNEYYSQDRVKFYFINNDSQDSYFLGERRNDVKCMDELKARVREWRLRNAPKEDIEELFKDNEKDIDDFLEEDLKNSCIAITISHIYKFSGRVFIPRINEKIRKMNIPVITIGIGPTKYERNCDGEFFENLHNFIQTSDKLFYVDGNKFLTEKSLMDSWNNIEKASGEYLEIILDVLLNEENIDNMKKEKILKLIGKCYERINHVIKNRNIV